ncbi:MAG: hypothetical protein CMI02_04350 [Oceanospirillaceae bacterium]|nr:hypothetical protein [Oceanospirillaceae bacterium]MBT11249.1 hypothetical protein [Oceanospirillaceae bacterium]|tara:strand:- start:103626 stop:104333 length:708 start_codon:yes stop_codon:yes gene_type:complete
MAEQDPYLTLLCSLPGFDALFAHRIPPLSRLRLDQRLLLLTDDDRSQLDAVEQILNWSRWPSGSDNAQALQQIHALLNSLNEPRVKQLTEDILDLHAVQHALHLRHTDKDYSRQPPATDWCISRFRSRLEQHWQDEDLGLGHYFLWLADAAEALKKQQLLAAEKIFFTSIWQHLLRQQPEDAFSFFAVVVYVLKWTLADRWSRTDGQQARQRFQQLLAAHQTAPDGHTSAEELSA